MITKVSPIAESFFEPPRKEKRGFFTSERQSTSAPAVKRGFMVLHGYNEQKRPVFQPVSLNQAEAWQRGLNWEEGKDSLDIQA